MSPDKNLPAQGPVTTRVRSGLSTEQRPGAGAEEALGGGRPGGAGGILLEILFPPPAQELHHRPSSVSWYFSVVVYVTLRQLGVYIYFNFSLKQGYANTYTHNSQQLKFLLLQFSSKELSKTLDSH